MAFNANLLMKFDLMRACACNSPILYIHTCSSNGESLYNSITVFHESDHVISLNNISQTISIRISVSARITSKEAIIRKLT